MVKGAPSGLSHLYIIMSICKGSGSGPARQRPPEAVEPQTRRAELGQFLHPVPRPEVAAEKPNLVRARDGSVRAEELLHRPVQPGEVLHVEPVLPPPRKPGLVQVDDVDGGSAQQDVLQRDVGVIHARFVEAAHFVGDPLDEVALLSGLEAA